MDDTAQYLRRAALDWEKLRIIYNLVLLAEILSLWGFRWIMETGMLNLFLLLGLFANACYCLGPATEICVCVFADRRFGWCRRGVFAVGLLFAMGVVFLVLR